MKDQLLKVAHYCCRYTGFIRPVTLVLVLTILIFNFNIAANAADYVIDNVASKVNWEAKKVTGKHHGTISFENGSISATQNIISEGILVINMKTIIDEDLTDVGYNKKLVGHLSSEDFFFVDKYPESKMVIKKVTSVSGIDFKFLADLTIKGVSNPIEFNAKISQNGDQLYAEGVMIINRAKYGIKYGSSSFFQGLGDKVIYDDFTLTFHVVATKK